MVDLILLGETISFKYNGQMKDFSVVKIFPKNDIYPISKVKIKSLDLKVVATITENFFLKQKEILKSLNP